MWERKLGNVRLFDLHDELVCLGLVTGTRRTSRTKMLYQPIIIKLSVKHIVYKV
jgi:hypothetical protein